MGSAGGGSSWRAHQSFRLILVWSLLLLTPLATAYEDRFCAEYLQNACSVPSSEEFVGSICKCFVKGPDACCNLDGEDGSLSPDMIGAFKSVFVSNASSVTYTQQCGTPQKVTFDKVNDGILNYEKKFAGLDCLMDFKAVDSTVDNILHCRRVQLYTASVKRISDSASLVNLVLDRSQAETIENFTLTTSTSEPVECLSFDGSRVTNMRNIVAMCDAHIDKTMIKQISGTSLFHSRISNTDIEEVLADGLTLQQGWHIIVNVTIKHLRKNALTFASLSDVNLYNLEIIQCDMPCIISRTKYVYFKNLIINGSKIEDLLDTPYVDVMKFAERTIIGPNSTLCQQIGNSLECRGDRETNYKVMEFVPEFVFPETKLSKFPLLGVTNHCFKVLTLEEVNGWVRTLQPEDPFYKDQCPYKYRKIVIKDCERIDYLQSDDLDQLEVQNSDVQFLDVSTRLSHVDMSNVKIHVLENLEYASRSGVQSYFTFKSVIISSVYNLLLKSSGLLTDFSVLGRVSNFTVDTSHDEMTQIRGGILRTVPAQGITIRSGVLVLDDVKILEMGYGAITIENSGQLWIVPRDLMEPFVCEKGPRIVARRPSQVVFDHPVPTPRWLRQCTISEGPYFEDQEEVKLKFKNFVSESNCIFDLQDHATCNMSNVRGPTLLSGSNALKSVVGVTVSNSANLTVGDHCFDLIKMEGVTSADFMDIKHSCYYKLILMDKTSVLNVVNNVYDLKVERSSIRKLAPSATLESVEAKNSTIRRLAVTIKKGLFMNVTIKDIILLTVTNEVEFINCNLTKFYKDSVTVYQGAILRFTNCSINMMSAKSFEVQGSVHMTNVTINLAENETIFIDRDSYVTMERVSFRKEVVNPFSIDSHPHILLNEVKMNKIKVKLDNRFDVALSYMNGTNVGQVHLDSETDARMKTVWLCLNKTEIICILLLSAALLASFVAFKFYQNRKETDTGICSKCNKKYIGREEQQQEQRPGQQEQRPGQQEQQQPGLMARQAQEALQAVQAPLQQGHVAPDSVPLKDIGSSESVCISTATTTTDASDCPKLVMESILSGFEDVGQGARSSKPSSSHKSAVAASAGVQPRKGEPKKTRAGASDDPEAARDCEDPGVGDEQPLLNLKV